MKEILQQVLIAHAKGEEKFAEKLAEPIREAGYEVAHQGTVIVGESIVKEASKALSSGSPVVLCGTIKALGTKWARQIVNAARNNYRVRVFCVQMDEEADVETLAFDECIAQYWQDPTKAQQDLVTALKKYYPLQAPADYVKGGNDAEQRYRELALESCDIIDLANLPESDRHIATKKLLLRQLYVALRVQVEIVFNAEVDEVELAAIEKRRIAMQRKRAGWSSEENETEDRGKRVPVGERLAKARRLVVLGDPGAGKTTMIRWISTAYLLRLKKDPDWKDLPDVSTLPDEDWLPIIIRCRDLKDVSLSGSLDDILHYTLRKAEMSEPECTALRGILKQKLLQGTALLLIDGLDEITDSLLRAKFCEQIEKICDAYKQAPIIVTSRIVGYREMNYRIGRQFEHVTVAELIKEDKDDFASRWCDITELPERKEKAKTELIQDIHSAERIERLTGNPMLLTTMALVKRKVGKLPTRRHKLYAQAVDVLLNWRSEVDKPIDDDEALPQLEYIAYAMCHRGVQQLRKDEVIELFEKFREEYPNLHDVKKHTPKEFLSFLERRTGILVEAGVIPHNGRDIPVFEFRHLTFQEYLAGLALVQGHFPNRRDRSLNLADYVAPLAAQINEVQSDHPVGLRSQQEVVVTENWREALRLCVASCNDDDVDDVLQAILKPLEAEDARTTARPRAVMAALCLADEPNVSYEVAQEVLQEFVRQIDEKDGVSSDISTTVDFAAIELSASYWSEELCNSILEKFCWRDTKNRITEQASIGGLYAVVTTNQAPEEETAFQQWLTEKLSQITSNQEVAAIGASLVVMELAFTNKISVSESVLICIIDGLLTMLSGSNPAAYASAWALLWLSPAGRENINASIWQPTTLQLDRIISIFNNPLLDSGAVYFLSVILGQIGSLQAVKPLIAKLDNVDKDVRQAIVEALGKIGSPQAVKPLIVKLDDVDQNVQQAVVEALGKIGSLQAVKPLIVKLDDVDQDVQQAVVEALGKIGSLQSVKPLIAKLDNVDKDVRQAIVEALGKIGSPQAVKPLIVKLDDVDQDVQRTVAGALGKIKDVRAVEPLITKLNDADSNVQRAVALALGEIKDARAVEPLIAKLNDADSDVQQAVEAALVKLGDAKTIQKLLNRLSSENQNTRVITLKALSWICQDKIDRKLLSRNVDALNPFLDPKKEIDEERVNYAAAQLKISVEDVRMRYQTLAQQFGLRLNFTTDVSSDY